MTLRELMQSLAQVVQDGSIGTPVALRIYTHLADPRCELSAAVAAFVEMGQALFNSPPLKLAAQSDAQDRQWNLLLNHAAGQTHSLTLIRGLAERSSIHLLLWGNHGLCRLEGGELWDATFAVDPAAANLWHERIQSSLESRAPVGV